LLDYCQQSAVIVGAWISNVWWRKPAMLVTSEAAVGKTAKTTIGSSGAMLRLLPIYYALAAFGVFTVVMSLYLNQGIMAIYTGSVEVNQRWAQRLTHYSELGQLAAAVDAPANDVFNSHDVGAEMAATRTTLDRFNTSLAALRGELRAKVNERGATLLLQDLQAVDAAMTQMTTEAADLFSYYAQNQVKPAGERMATMDRRYGDVNAALASLRTHVAAIQKQHFDEQLTAAAALQKFEYLVGVLVVVMVGGITAYGYKLAKQEAAHQRELQHHMASLRDAEARTRSILDTAADGIEVTAASCRRVRELHQV
jgi:hypothetical protein